jgi:MFS family permease
VGARRDLSSSLIDGGAWAVMTGAGEMYLPAFIVALALGDVASGLVATVPPAAAAFVQLASSRGVRGLGSHKKWVVLSSAVQAASWFPLAVCAAVGGAPGWLVFALVSAYYAAGMAGGTAWSTWVGTIVPRRVRARFFAKRQRVLNLATLVGFGAAGLVLDLTTGGVAVADAIVDPERRRAVLWAFAGLLTAAGLARGVSVWFLLRQSEPTPLPAGQRDVPLPVLLKHLLRPARLRKAGVHAVAADVHAPGVRALRLMGFILALQFAAKVCDPYIIPYLLKGLGVPWRLFTVVVAAQMLGKVLALPLWGRFVKAYGPHRLVLVAGLAVVPLGALWALVPVEAAKTPVGLVGLIGLQLLTGFAWAAYDLGTFLLLLEDVDERERTSLVTYLVLGTWLCSMAGSLLGAAVLWGASVGAEQPAAADYWWVFVGSTVLRAVIAATVLPALVRGRNHP